MSILRVDPILNKAGDTAQMEATEDASILNATTPDELKAARPAALEV